MPDVYKMINATKEEACRSAEADAIREKTGESASLAFDFENEKGFAEAIAAIPTGGGEIYVGTYKILHEVVTVQSAFSGGVVVFSNFLMGLTSFSDKEFLWFSQKPKDSYTQNEWYCGGVKIANLFGFGNADQGYRYHNNVWNVAPFAASYDAVATAGSQYDVYAVDYTASI